jgi:hypothetical protein
MGDGLGDGLSDGLGDGLGDGRGDGLRDGLGVSTLWPGCNPITRNDIVGPEALMSVMVIPVDKIVPD